MFTGNIVALVMPMDEKGKACRSSLKKLINYHIASDISAIVSVDTTGESATLSHGEHGDVVMMMLELVDRRTPVIVGTGANAIAEAISLTQCLSDSGAVGCLTVTSYYNRPIQEGLFQHLKVIVERTDLPQILYNVPSRTGCDVLPEAIGRLAKVKNIIAIKEATGNLSRVHQVKELASDDFILLSGNDATGLDFMQLDGCGVISVTSSVAARDMAEMCKLTVAGQFAGARVIDQHLMPLHNKLFVEPNLIPVKWVCKTLGLVVTDTPRLLMTPITDSAREIVKAALKYAGLL